MAGFKKRRRFLPALLLLCMAGTASAQTISALSLVRVLHDALHSAGGHVTGDNCSEDGSLGGLTGVSTSASGLISDRGGWTAQLSEAVALQVNSPQYVNEGEVLPLHVLEKQNDDTFTALSASGITWSVIRGAENASVSPDGKVLAAIVYQESAAVIRLLHSGLSDDHAPISTSVVVVIKDINPDNFGLYAADGLPDLWQVRHFGINSLLAGPNLDPDGDGKDNRNEYLARTLPLSSASVFNPAVIGGPGLWRIEFPTAPDRHYVLETSLTMAPGSWSVIGGPLAGTGGNLSFPITVEVGDSRFYRVAVIP